MLASRFLRYFRIPKDIAGAALVGVEQTGISGEGKPGAVITIDGSQDVVIENATVRDGLDGILARSGASARLINVSAVENDDDGFQFEEASEVQCIDCLASRNGGDGFSILRSPEGLLPGRSPAADTASPTPAITPQALSQLPTGQASALHVDSARAVQVKNWRPAQASRHTWPVQCTPR